MVGFKGNSEGEATAIATNIMSFKTSILLTPKRDIVLKFDLSLPQCLNLASSSFHFFYPCNLRYNDNTVLVVENKEALH